MKARFLTLLLALAPLLFGQYKPWYNFYNFSYGAKARAMGNAFTAVADDLTAAFWNPAGLASRRSPEFYLSYGTVAQKHSYDPQGRDMAGEIKLFKYDFSGRLNQIDFFSVSAPSRIGKRDWTFALSYYRYIPYGFKGSAQSVLTYLDDRFNPRKTTVTFMGSEGIDVLAFSAAAAVSNRIALGATLQQFFGSGFLHLRSVEPAGEFHSQLTEKLQGRNVIAGLLYSPLDFLRLGFTWHSGLRSRFDSTLRTWEVIKKVNVSDQLVESGPARVVIPEQYALGALLQPARWLDLSAEYSRLDWEKGSLENYYGSATALPFPQKNDLAQSQKEIRNLRFGAEARLPLRRWLLRLRGGWSAERPLYADTDDQAVTIRAFSVGLGCEFSRNLLLEVAYQRQMADWLEDSYFAQEPDVGTHFRANVFNLSLTYRFGHIFKE